MNYKLLCVDKWRSEWHYRNYGVVVGDKQFDDVREAAYSLRLSPHSLHKAITRMDTTIDGNFPVYVVYKDEAVVVTAENDGNKETRVLGDSSGKRRRDQDHDNNLRTTRLRRH